MNDTLQAYKDKTCMFRHHIACLMTYSKRRVEEHILEILGWYCRGKVYANSTIRYYRLLSMYLLHLSLPFFFLVLSELLIKLLIGTKIGLGLKNGMALLLGYGDDMIVKKVFLGYTMVGYYRKSF